MGGVTWCQAACHAIDTTARIVWLRRAVASFLSFSRAVRCSSLSVVTEMQLKVQRSVKTGRSVVGYIVPKINTRKGKALFFFVDCWYFQCTNVVSH